MTSFGEHGAYVREIMDFVKSGGLLSSRRALSGRDRKWSSGFSGREGAGSGSHWAADLGPTRGKERCHHR
jgi:hypothetical protein